MSHAYNSVDHMLVFFDIENDIPDSKGIEVADLRAAEAAAITGLASIVSELDWDKASSLSVGIRSGSGDLISKVKLTISVDRPAPG